MKYAIMAAAFLTIGSSAASAQYYQQPYQPIPMPQYHPAPMPQYYQQYQQQQRDNEQRSYNIQTQHMLGSMSTSPR
jgi:hypothetical protein